MTRLGTIRVFTADGCPHCAALRADFTRRRVVFDEINLSRQPERVDELREICWEHRLPVVMDHERLSIGFHGRSSSLEELGLE